jgi:prephenate dehydrogenase
MKIAIIGGYGKMGRWLATLLKAEGKEVVIAGRNQEKLQAVADELDIACTMDNNAAIEGAEYIVLSVPIDSFEGVVKEIGGNVQPGQAVIDITSTKEFPVNQMHRHIKEGLVLGAHPLFGPGASNLANKNFILTPTNEEEAALADRVSEFIEERDGRVTVMTPREHDETMSMVLGLSHFIAIVSADTLLTLGRYKALELAGSSTYKVLLILLESVLTEDPELYASIQLSLPKVNEYEKTFNAMAQEWADLVRHKDRRGFVKRMENLKAQMERVSPDYGQAYEKMYRIVEGM